MKTNKVSHKDETKPVIDNPLVDIAGKFGGEFWRETQSEVETYRQADKEETIKLLASQLDLEN